MDEKRQKLLKIYTESKEVFNLKEIEKRGSKVGVGEMICHLLLEHIIYNAMTF